ncbi:putative GNAT family N-acyltransferase [Bacilli bacterium PM5-9]|nr:putative GNAT family N-acyltransferase [Bacilli bacterium PM5-9]
MIEGIKKKKFKECDLNDIFFNSLKNDYEGFENWFKSKSEESAYIIDENGLIEGFMYIKFDEDEVIEFENGTNIDADPTRMKIGTFKTNDVIRGRRFGEGLLGVALKEWSNNKRCNSIYVTTFPKQKELIGMLERYGFLLKGELKNSGGELVYMKLKTDIDFDDPYKSFPYINRKRKGKMILINEEYHDNLFPNSILKNTKANIFPSDVRNGIVKTFVSESKTLLELKKGDFGIIYRQSNDEPKRHKSCVTGFCAIINTEKVKDNNKFFMTLNNFKLKLRNKTTLADEKIDEYYNKSKNLIIINMLYCFALGEGNNVTYQKLIENNLWSSKGSHPYSRNYVFNDLKKIIELSGKNVQNTYID